MGAVTEGAKSKGTKDAVRALFCIAAPHTRFEGKPEYVCRRG